MPGPDLPDDVLRWLRRFPPPVEIRAIVLMLRSKQHSAQCGDEDCPATYTIHSSGHMVCVLPADEFRSAFNDRVDGGATLTITEYDYKGVKLQ